jgi:hypothetical protein
MLKRIIMLTAAAIIPAGMVKANNQPSPWRPVVMDRLRQLLKDGKSAREIAIIMTAEGLGTFTRNSVIGRCHRQGLTRLKPSKPKAPKPPPRSAKAISEKDHIPKNNQAANNWAPPGTTARAKVETNQAAWNAIHGAKPVTMIQLEKNHCRWPIEIDGQTLFCGKHKNLTSYCKEHESKAFFRNGLTFSRYERMLRRYISQ